MQALKALLLVLSLSLVACSGGSSGGTGGGGATSGSNRARFTFDVDLQGVAGQLVMEVEAINSPGIVWTGGSSPQVSAVIDVGTYIFYTAGQLTSPVTSYVFTGENNFADFTELGTNAMFRVQWIETPQGMTMVVNPFGPGPVSYNCVLTSAVLL